MDWSPQTNYHRTYYKALDTPDLVESSLSVMSLGDKDQCIFVCITEEVAHTREIHPLDPQPHRYCMLASTASAPQVTRCSLGLYWSRDLCSKHAAADRLAGWGMSSYLGQIVRGSEI